MKLRRKLFWTVVACAVLVGLIGWQRRWLASEPTYGGKTVTEWLDRMPLFDEERQRDVTGQTGFDLKRSPEAVANDPAIRALKHIGSNAVPVLMKLLTDPPEWPPTMGPMTRLKMRMEWRWQQWRSPTPVPRPAPEGYSSFQSARKTAAAFMLLTLGTNSNGGFARIMEACTAAQWRPFFDAGFTPLPVIFTAKYGLPDRKVEIIADISSGLRHTNAGFRSFSAFATYSLRENLPSWKPLLLRLTEDENADVRLSAFWALVTTDPQDADIITLAENFCETVRNQRGSDLWRPLDWDQEPKRPTGFHFCAKRSKTRIAMCKEKRTGRSRVLRSEGLLIRPLNQDRFFPQICSSARGSKPEFSPSTSSDAD